MAKSKVFLTQLIKYAFIGVVNNSIGYLLYFILTALWLPPKIAVTFLYALGALIGFIGNKKITFAYHGNLFTAGLRYFATHFIGYLFNLLILMIGVDHLGYPHQIVQIYAIFVVAIFLFIAFKYFVFSNGEKVSKENLE